MKARVAAHSPGIVRDQASATAVLSVRRIYIVLGILTLIGFALRIYRLNHTSLWMDEVLMMARADPANSWREFFWYPYTLPHPPLHHGLLKVWMTLFGYTEFQGRLVSVILGTLSIPATFLLARSFASDKASLLAALVATVNYYLIFFSRDLASYAHLFTAACISYFFFIALCRDPTFWRGVGYTISTLVVLHVHFQGAYMIAGQLAGALYLGITRGGVLGAWKMTLRFTAPGSILALSLIPMAETIRRGASQEYFLKSAPDGSFPLQYFYEFFGNNVVLAMLAALPILTLIFVRVHRWTVRSPADLSNLRGDNQKDAGVAILLVMLVAALALHYIVSVAIKPMLFHRYTMYTLPIYLVLLAVGFDQFRGTIKRWAFVMALLIMSLFVLLIGKDIYSVTVRFDQPREVAKYIAEKNSEFRIDRSRYVSIHPPLMQFYMRSWGINTPLERYRTNEDIVRILSTSVSGDYFWLVINGWEAPKQTVDFVSSRYERVLERRFVRGYAGLYRIK